MTNASGGMTVFAVRRHRPSCRCVSVKTALHRGRPAAELRSRLRRPGQLDERPIRRARNRVLAARSDLTHRATAALPGGAAWAHRP
ncbi:DUF6284 family protein [Streptomyces sp. Edi2]|uniref:DUF6284 family protein n=1 Tax=Streptomyces sp. Edi2 TaxID=3162528 RepID=UPI00330565F8